MTDYNEKACDFERRLTAFFLTAPSFETIALTAPVAFLAAIARSLPGQRGAEAAIEAAIETLRLGRVGLEAMGYESFCKNMQIEGPLPPHSPETDRRIAELKAVLAPFAELHREIANNPDLIGPAVSTPIMQALAAAHAAHGDYDPIPTQPETL